MAIPWIKIENVTPDKPEIFQLAELLGIDPDAALGKCVRLWVWADSQTYDGNAGSVTDILLDRVAGCQGFTDAMKKVGWIQVKNKRLFFPNFDRHNGESAKKRAQGAKRQEKSRKTVTQLSRKSNAASVTKASPDKNRLDKNRLKKNPLPPCLDTEKFKQAWGDWENHRTEIRKKLTPTSIKKQLKELEAMGHDRAIQTINFTIGKGWQGLRQPDESGNGKNGQASFLDPASQRRAAKRAKEYPENFEL